MNDLTWRRAIRDGISLVLATCVLIALCAVATPARAASWPSQGAEHSGRCRGALPPRPAIRIPGYYVCVRTGWLWVSVPTSPPRQ